MATHVRFVWDTDLRMYLEVLNPSCLRAQSELCYEEKVRADLLGGLPKSCRPLLYHP